MVKLLLSKGANPSIKDKVGRDSAGPPVFFSDQYLKKPPPLVGRRRKAFIHPPSPAPFPLRTAARRSTLPRITTTPRSLRFFKVRNSFRD